MERIEILIIIALCTAIFAAVEFHSIAQKKGYDDGRYFVHSLLCGPAGG